MKKIVWLALLFSSVGYAKSLSLPDAISLALRYNPNIQSADLNRIIQKFDLRVAQNEFELQYALTGTTNVAKSKVMGSPFPSTHAHNVTPEVHVRSSIGTDISVAMDNHYDEFNYNPQVTVSVKQPLLRGFGRSVTLKGLRDAYDDEYINRLLLKQTIIAQVLAVIKNYRTVILDNNNLIISQTAVKDAEKNVDVIQARIKAGQLARTANLQAKTQLEQLKLNLSQAENQLRQDKQRLLESIGLEPDFEISLPEDVKIQHLLHPKEKDAIGISLANNIEYLVQLINLEKDQRNLMLAHDEQRWQLNLVASATVGSPFSAPSPDSHFNSLWNGRNQSSGVSLSLDIPIDNYPLRRKLVDAKINCENRQVQIGAARRKVITEVKNQLFDIESQLQQIKLAKSSVELARHAYQVEKKKHLVGRSSTLDVVDSQDKLINAKSQLISRKISYLNALDDLAGSQGTLLDQLGIIVNY